MNIGDCFESSNVIYKVIEKGKNYKVVCEVYSKDENWLMGISIENEKRLDKMRKLGYIKGNVIVISMRANRIKNNSNFEEIEKLYNFLKNLRENK